LEDLGINYYYNIIKIDVKEIDGRIFTGFIGLGIRSGKLL
jgi:hypothetical protein